MGATLIKGCCGGQAEAHVAGQVPTRGPHSFIDPYCRLYNGNNQISCKYLSFFLTILRYLTGCREGQIFYEVLQALQLRKRADDSAIMKASRDGPEQSCLFKPEIFRQPLNEVFLWKFGKTCPSKMSCC